MKKTLFWTVLVIWIVLTVGVYTIGATNSWFFHDESLITYTTSGMTHQQASSFYEYIDTFTNKEGVNKYELPTFIPSVNGLLLLDNGNNTYKAELQIPNYQQYELSIKSRQQSKGMLTLCAFSGGVLLVFGGILGVAPLHMYAYDKKEFDKIFHSKESK